MESVPLWDHCGTPELEWWAGMLEWFWELESARRKPKGTKARLKRLFEMHKVRFQAWCSSSSPHQTAGGLIVAG